MEFPQILDPILESIGKYGAWKNHKIVDEFGSTISHDNNFFRYFSNQSLKINDSLPTTIPFAIVRENYSTIYHQNSLIACKTRL